jgi:hypothetical protein
MYFLLSKTVTLGKNLNTFLFAAFCTTAIFGVVTYTVLVYLVNWLSLVCLVGSLSLNTAQSLPHSIVSFFFSAFKAPRAYIGRFKKQSKANNSGTFVWLKKMMLFIVPLIIISLFLIIYRSSNPKFDSMMSEFFSWVEPSLVWLGKNLNLTLIFTFSLCLFISIFATVYSQSKTIAEAVNSCQDQLTRKRRMWPIFKFNGLKNEFTSAVFLFSGLNILLLVVNIIDIQWVWFDFEWNGQYLKQFVHEGTYLLIFSILISFALVLYSFRENLNFYSKNGLLKKLSIVWLAQNIILTISVGIRNYHYIQHFALAYKRIAVLFFLILTVIALALVMVKVLRTKSLYFVVRYNVWAMFTVLFVCSLFPWDSIIIQYNFAQKDKAFVHFNFLSKMENKNVDLLERPISELVLIEEFNATKVGRKSYYMSAENYHEKVENKKAQFIAEWESKTWLSWNYPESQAYKHLKYAK